MSDATPTNGKGFGTNQKLAAIGYGMTIALSAAFVFTGHVDGKQWLDYTLIFVPVGVGTVTGLSAGIKIAGVIKEIVASLGKGGA